MTIHILSDRRLPISNSPVAAVPLLPRSGFVQYDYYGFGRRGVTFIDNVSGTVGPLDIKQNIQVIKLGVNFRVYPTSAPLW